MKHLAMAMKVLYETGHLTKPHWEACRRAFSGPFQRVWLAAHVLGQGSGELPRTAGDGATKPGQPNQRKAAGLCGTTGTPAQPSGRSANPPYREHGRMGTLARSASGGSSPQQEGADAGPCQSPNIFCLSSRRCCASSDKLAVGRAISRATPMASPVSSQ